MALHREGGVVVAADDALSSARRVAQRLVVDLRAELDGIIAVQEADPPDDEHDVEGASVGFERARVTALLSAAERRSAELEEAVRRRDAGEPVGRCSSCGADIGDERLAAVPSARHCVRCASAATPSVRSRR